ncbi:hypothetical protein HK100_000730 [Physocladia obscura]|uniref:Uncharacterized protein n=1 Tax=Physocladia obscura TaxID=109957 RepID=A0AAD5SXV5_9FUNG|nr:hypothetical protein HK100_000730 [Physocladia obscura]
MAERQRIVERSVVYSYWSLAWLNDLLQLGRKKPFWAVPVTLGIAFSLMPNSGDSSSIYPAVPFIVVGIINALLGPQCNLPMRSHVPKIGMKVIKYQALEESFLSVISKSRSMQLRVAVKINFLSGTMRGCFEIQKVVAPMETMLIIVSTGGILTPSIGFLSLSLFYVIFTAMEAVPTRLRSFLLAEELDESEKTRISSFADSKEEEFQLKQEVVEKTGKKKKALKTNEDDGSVAFKLLNTTLTIPYGSLVAAVGPVGSGKSSFLAAFIGHMRKTAGVAFVYGKRAMDYIRHSSRKHYDIHAAVKAAGMSEDLQTLPSGLSKYIGEKVVNLSGGQRARVLGCAIASDADIFLLDDPLAALNSHVGKAVFEGAICETLKDKAVFGSFEELMAEPGGELTLIMKNYVYNDAKKEELVEPKRSVVRNQTIPRNTTDTNISDGIKAETAVAEDRFKFLLAIIVEIITTIGTNVMTKIVLAFWAGNNEFSLSSFQYQNLYTGLAIGSASSIVLTIFVLYYGGYYAGKFYHSKALAGLFNAALSYFKTQPLGRILSRMVDDVTEMDTVMTENLATLITSLSLVLAALSLIGYAVSYLLSNGSISGSLIRLSLSERFGLSTLVLTLLARLGAAEAEFNSVERINHYVYNLPHEAPRKLPSDLPKRSWPTAGAIEFENVTLAYDTRPDNFVIKSLSATIRGGEKIGVVGRTGSGKSSLMSAIFRLLEPTTGRIIIDGVDISILGLASLRSSLQIISQDPVLFKGTTRSNLTLSRDFSDNEIWEVLDLVVDENGSSISLGQRQLLCLCKALLARPRLRIMDEATASVDREADMRIQKAISTQLKDTTVLCIAHRLNTVAEFDRVMVLDAGALIEFDSP